MYVLISHLLGNLEAEALRILILAKF
jgi:hypothetical protein